VFTSVWWQVSVGISFVLNWPVIVDHLVSFFSLYVPEGFQLRPVKRGRKITMSLKKISPIILVIDVNQKRLLKPESENLNGVKEGFY
jgi:hypothetical protein